MEAKDGSFTIYLEEGNVLELAFFKSDTAMNYYKEFRDGKRLKDPERGKMKNPQDSGTPIQVKINE